MINMLFLCTGNSARSILSEGILRDLGRGRFKAFSAGSRPTGTPHPEGIAELKRHGHSVLYLESKSWDIYATNDAPFMDIIVTVCSSAAGETCPIWPKRDGESPIIVHWDTEDPASVEPLDARQAAFSYVYDVCRKRVEILLDLPPSTVKDKSILQTIGNIS